MLFTGFLIRNNGRIYSLIWHQSLVDCYSIVYCKSLFNDLFFFLIKIAQPAIYYLYPIDKILITLMLKRCIPVTINIKTRINIADDIYFVINDSRMSSALNRQFLSCRVKQTRLDVTILFKYRNRLFLLKT